ncbi:iron-sulfur cluster carrier protein ApbC [Motilimonas sp. 1_MG-2023]|uniref:iron-sulfur cluster carrier protein ApbC n=1 Tax=Motilimonas sp. 1_MG-2023 TaxID=3062672 RepID=UPI0026E127A5|nr:iron-sulfur cluster carrier protein ApbC [Motilimonas sp. 1_MG-2023]MDO6525502.1 iron-sulfur cluster carrier protein ApbC [Motilimonas sp. 1_MG-2023]
MDGKLDRAMAVLAASGGNELIKTLHSRGAFKLSDGLLTLRKPFYAPTWFDTLKAKTQVKLAALGITLHCQNQVATLQSNIASPIAGIKNVLVVASGKGGVGKSTVSVNLALALAVKGAKVGILDADIYGPSMPLMLGQSEAKPESHDGKTMLPIKAHGVVANSIGFLVDKNDATVWRGPMASKALAQILRETQWGELDYLVVDMPPGTGDIQLTMAQQVPVTSALIVTTPQNVALADATKGINMFTKVNVPVLGLVENMSMHVCSQCGHEEAIFDQGGGVTLAHAHNSECLAQLPLHRQYREDTDAGTPTVIKSPDSPLSQAYLELAEKVAIKLYQDCALGVQTISVVSVD